jgi:hypothetical protein
MKHDVQNAPRWAAHSVEPTSVVVAVADHHLRRRRRRRRQATATTAAHPLRSPHPNPTLLGFLNIPTTRHRETLVARVGQTGPHAARPPVRLTLRWPLLLRPHWPLRRPLGHLLRRCAAPHVPSLPSLGSVAPSARKLSRACWLGLP